MKATAVEFRFRVVIIVLLIALGFWAPWIDWLHLGSRTTAWLWLGFEISRFGISSATGIEIVIMITIAVAALAAWLRVWGTAYLGSGVVNNAQMKAGAVLADGPYRYVRNPLYLGSWLMVVAISILMPPTGALFTIVLLAIFHVRLILGEEAFLTAQLGEPYLAFRRAVPRLFPSLRTQAASGGRAPRWGRAVLAELMPIGVLVSFAALSWQYNANLIDRALLVSFGISLVARAVLLPQAE